MSIELKKNLWHALFVGILSGVVIGVYAGLGLETPLYWAAFIVLPVVFMSGGRWPDVLPHIGNAWFGVFIGWACFQLVSMTTPVVGLPLAFGLATAVCTVVLQGMTGGFLASSLGRCPMAFVGMITCFAAGGTNLLTAVISLACGIVAATAMVQSGKIAARLSGFREKG